MKNSLFEDLMQSLKEAKAIARGEAQASRRITVTPPDVKAIRELKMYTSIPVYISIQLFEINE
jgi:hypothetical protein